MTLTGTTPQRRSRLLRFAILLIALVQSGTVLLPHQGSSSGASSAVPHWHAAGDPLEFTHDEHACPSCNHAVSIISPLAVRVAVGLPAAVTGHFAASDVVQQLTAFTSIQSRAPPSRV